MKRIFTLVFCMMILELLHSQAALKEELSDVEIIVTGVKENAGTIVISVHDSAESFGKRIPYLTAKSDADGEKSVYHVQLKNGEYAFCIYQDVNRDGKLNTNAIGIPKEPLGFSNYDGKTPPGNFKKHKVFVDGAMTITIPLIKL